MIMEKTLVFIDEGYLSKISKHFGKGKYKKHDKNQFTITLAKKQGLWVDGVYLYVAPPFQSTPPTENETYRMEGHKGFVASLRNIPNFIVREGRVQKINEDYTQKGVDTLLTMDLLTEPFIKNIRTIIIVACDTDFVPILNQIRQKGVRVILYYFNDFVRNSEFAMSNYILTACDKTVLIDEDCFNKSLLKSKEEKNKNN